ncbi:MAG: hypothetical protein RXR82_07330 [Nitrososphaeria archaeon]
MSMLHIYHSRVPLRLVKGKPYVTVSAKGISNGLSDTYNDGADFGPDTMLGATAPDQYGPPYTQTTGIQEALNYAAQIGAPVELGPGTFYVSTTIQLPNMSGLVLRGTSEYLTTIEQAPGFSGTIMQWANPNAVNDMYYFGHFRLYGVNGNGQIFLMDLKQNETATNGLIESVHIHHANAKGIRLDGNDDTITVKLYIDNGGGSDIGYVWFSPNGAGADFYSDLFSGAYINAQSFTFVGTVFGPNQNLNLTPLSGQPSIINFFGCYWNQGTYPPRIWVYGSSGELNTYVLNFVGCMINPNTQSLPNPFIYNNSTYSVTVYAKFINSLIQSSSAVDLFGATSGGSLNGYAEFEDLAQPPTNVNINNAAVSTPAVPSSGTAQQNTNPFPVVVYLSGGSATQVQVTKGGNTYTIWSSSSATAIPFMSVRLNPGDSITITYSTAPSWTWTPA